MTQLWEELKRRQDTLTNLEHEMRSATPRMANIVSHNLESADYSALRRIKAELKRFDSRTGKWRAPR